MVRGYIGFVGFKGTRPVCFARPQIGADAFLVWPTPVRHEWPLLHIVWLTSISMPAASFAAWRLCERHAFLPFWVPPLLTTIINQLRVLIWHWSQFCTSFQTSPRRRASFFTFPKKITPTLSQVHQPGLLLKIFQHLSRNTVKLYNPVLVLIIPPRIVCLDLGKLIHYSNH